MIHTIVNVLQMIGVVVGFFTLLTIATQKASENQKILLTACSCAFLSILAYTLEINADSLDAMIMAVKFGYVGKCYVMLFFLMFMTGYCRVPLPKGIFRFFTTFNTLLLAIIFTCDKHELYYKNLRVSYQGHFPHIVFEKGICYWLFMTVMICLFFWYIVLSVKESVKRKGIERKRLMLLSFAGMIPVYMLVLYLTGIMNIFDPVPLGIVLSCTLLTLNVGKYGLLDTMQLAKEKVIENTKEGLLVMDPNLNLLYANPIARRIMPDMQSEAKSRKQLEEVFNSKQGEAVIEKDGCNYEIRVSRITDENHAETIRGYIVWIFEMTFVNQYTEEMIRLKEEAEKANLAKTSFLAHMSHEIRTPMNAIIGFSDLCLKSEPEGEFLEYVGNIRESADTLMNLIDEVLDISKIESGKMELVEIEYDVRALMNEVVSVIVPQIDQKRLTLRYLLEPHIPAGLKGDKKRIKEIMMNLLANAVKYTPEGTILFKVKEVERTKEKILLEIDVKDTGIGIREEDKERIFQKFEQSDVRKNYMVEGTGLGLSIVKNLAEMMNGSVEVEGTYGEGTLFRVRIWQKIADERPAGECRGSNGSHLKDVLSQLKKPSHDTAKKNFSNISFPGTKVLVVDDNEVNLKVAFGLLRLYDIQPKLVASGQECLEEAKKAVYDIVFMDQMMPEMDGVETLRRLRTIRDEYERVPVVALTANVLVGVREEMLKLGFDDFLGKPIDLRELENVLRRYAKETETSGTEHKNEKNPAGRKGQEEEDKWASYDEILCRGGIDVKRGLEICGDRESYLEILDVFFQNTLKTQKNLSEALENRDYERYTILVHALKSAAASIGALDLSVAAKEMEMAGREARFCDIEKNNNRLIEDYALVTDYIGHFLAEVEKNIQTIVG